jgi:hypothetical protein
MRPSAHRFTAACILLNDDRVSEFFGLDYYFQEFILFDEFLLKDFNQVGLGQRC